MSRTERQQREMAYDVFLIVLATALMVAPQWFSTSKRKRHARRLAELHDGALENYFEERRSLETYRPRWQTWHYRLFGLVMMACAIAGLLRR